MLRFNNSLLEDLKFIFGSRYILSAFVSGVCIVYITDGDENDSNDDFGSGAMYVL